MPKLLSNYSVGGGEPNIGINTTSWIYNSSTSVQLTVTVGDSERPYDGVVNLSYGSGISGPSSVECVNGAATISISRSGLNTTTLTVTVPKSATNKEGVQQFTGTMSGQTVYADNTRWVHRGNRPEGEAGDAGGCYGWTYSYSLVVGGSTLWSSSRGFEDPLTINGVTYRRGDVADSGSWTSSTPITCKGKRRWTYYYVVFA